ncbi:CZB domain-containing protein [uncultured Cohaesibacter sp.]|uniref:CZB domain-containing protein n=1 Tax=uncultured Cohaesibacter sp. TaxID=1002546 RepID=UPI0029C8BD13|nr:CZB domain-containing protein [uncultured Cohaesibacter sp.]
MDHIIFKRDVVQTCFDSAEVAVAHLPDHHHCRLGKWYDTLQNSDIRNSATFKALIGPHEETHSSAKRALEAHAAGEDERMVQELHTLDQSSKRVVELLDVLAREILEGRKT